MVVSENEPSFDKNKDHYSSKMIMFVGLSVRKPGTNNGHYLKRRKKKRTKINKSYPKEFRCFLMHAIVPPVAKSLALVTAGES